MRHPLHPGTDPRSAAVNARVSRRRAMQLGGFAGLTGLLAACGSTTLPDAQAANDGASGAAASGDAGTIDAHLVSLLDSAPQCALTEEETQGPYWFDVDDLRSDVREDRAGAPLHLALSVQDVSSCSPGAGGGPSGADPIEGAVVEIWQCDAMGVYSGFRNGFGAAIADGPGGTNPPPLPDDDTAAPPPPPAGAAPPDGQAPPGGPHPGPASFDGQGAPTSGPVSDGSYSFGDTESIPSTDATFLRGAQVTGRDGTVRFTSIFPGWYSGRTVHVHIKVHRNKSTVLTTQLYFDDALTDRVLTSGSPYTLRGARDTRNATDPLYDPTSQAAARRTGGAVLAALNLGVQG